MSASPWAALAASSALACLAACAADPGDPPKDSSGDGSSTPDTATFDSGGQPYDSYVPPEDSIGPMTDSSVPTDTSTPVDASMPSESAPPDDSPVVDETGPPPTGCATGATVIKLTMTGSTSNFGTTGAVCVTYMGSVNGWNASNVQGRSVSAVGSTTQTPAITGDSIGNQPGLMPGTDGYIYWNYTAGAVSYSSMDLF
jgi:hypothetical protein